MTAQGGTAGALNSGLDVLEALATQSQGLGVTEVARRTGLDKGNVHRLLRALEHRGYVEQDPTTKRYSATVMTLTLARSVLHGLDLLTCARVVMGPLSQEVGESVHVAKRTRVGAVYIAQVRQPGRVSVETEIGAQPVIHATATGKSLYLYDDEESVRSVLELPLYAYTEHTLTTVSALMAELATTVERGYAIDDEEMTLDVRCVAAPIFDMYGSVTACIGISGPSSRVSHARLGELGEHVRLAAETVTNYMGGRLPQPSDAHPRP